jgi:hypothetical protein
LAELIPLPLNWPSTHFVWSLDQEGLCGKPFCPPGPSSASICLTNPSNPSNVLQEPGQLVTCPG